MIKSLFIKIYISEISISIKGVKIKFGIIIKKTYSRFSDTFSNKIDVTAYDL